MAMSSTRGSTHSLLDPETNPNGQDELDQFVQQREPVVQVANRALFDDLVSSIRPVYSASGRPRTSSRGGPNASSIQAERERRRRAHHAFKMHQLRAKHEQLVEEQDRKLHDEIDGVLRQKDMKFHHMLASLDNEAHIVHTIEHHIDDLEERANRRKQSLFNEWSRNVYRPIQAQIEEQLASSSAHDMEKRRHELYQEYITATNNGKGLYRDIVNSSEYDPFQGNSLAGKYSTKHLDDPCERDLKRMRDEKRLQSRMQASANKRSTSKHRRGRSATLPRAAGGKTRVPMDVPRLYVDVKLWDKLESTPFGRYAKIDEAAQQGKVKQLSAMHKKLTRSNVKFDHYDVTRDPAVATQEYFSGNGAKQIDLSKKKFRIPYGTEADL